MAKFEIMILCIRSVLVFMDGMCLDAYILKLYRTINKPNSFILSLFKKIFETL